MLLEIRIGVGHQLPTGPTEDVDGTSHHVRRPHPPLPSHPRGVHRPIFGVYLKRKNIEWVTSLAIDPRNELPSALRKGTYIYFFHSTLTKFQMSKGLWTLAATEKDVLLLNQILGSDLRRFL